MYRPLAMLLSAVGLFAFTPGLRAADETAKDVLARAIKAHGGEETLAKYKAIQSKNKGKITIPGVGEVDFTQEVAAMQPDKFKESLELKIAGQTISVVTLASGDKFSIEANGKAVEVGDTIKAALKDASHLMKVARLTNLVRDKGYELSLIGEDKVEGKPVIGVRVTTKGEKDVSLYFDKKTGLLAKLEHRTVDAQTGNELTEERIIVEYGESKDGIARPKKVLVKHDSKNFLEAEVLEITYLEKLDDSEFKK